MNKGFTLAEILIVMAIVAIVGTILVTIFTNTLRGSNKAQALAVIKQNGQAVLENMDKTIRNSDNVVCPTLTSPTGKTLVIVKNGVYTRYRFISPTSSDNGRIQQDNPVKQDVVGTSPLRKETDNEFIDRVCDMTISMTGASTLSDTNQQSGVSVLSGALFTRNWESGFKDSVTISFILESGIGIGAAVSSQIEPVTFQTTIQLR